MFLAVPGTLSRVPVSTDSDTEIKSFSWRSANDLVTSPSMRLSKLQFFKVQNESLRTLPISQVFLHNLVNRVGLAKSLGSGKDPNPEEPQSCQKGPLLPTPQGEEKGKKEPSRW